MGKHRTGISTLRFQEVSIAAICAATGFIIPPPTSSATPPAVQFTFVPGADDQPGGPTHDFRISRFEIRNDQFVTFLNDALANPINERGAYMFFESTTGDVYINDAQTGQIGSDAGSRGIRMFSPSTAGQIEWLNNQYQVVTTPTDYSAHPVTGVSWYGAVKYCNWLTLDKGLSSSDRAYNEALDSEPSGWRPVTISSAGWGLHDLTTSERNELLLVRGIRLPMDGGDGAPQPGTHNEWHKVASRKPDDPQGQPVFGALYGFGRDVIAGPDANFRCSADPFEDFADCIIGGTTPVGFYDGVNLLTTLTPTTDTANGYGVYDLSGNVWEWMQDQGFDPSDRRNRGGSFRSSASSLAVTISADRSADALNDSTGFRVVQSVVDALLLTPDTNLDLSGPWGGPYASAQVPSITYSLENLTNRDIVISIATNEPWLSTVSTPPTNNTLGPGETLALDLIVDPACDDGLTVGSHVATMSIDNVTDGTRIDRTAQVTVTEPLTLAPTGAYVITTDFGENPPPRNFTITNASEKPIQWTADWTDTSPQAPSVDWLSLKGSTTGHTDTAPPLDAQDLEVSIDVTHLDEGDYSADITITDECTGSTLVRQVQLTVQAPFDVSPTDDAVARGVVGGPFSPDEFTYKLTSRATEPIDWIVSLLPIAPETDTSWLSVLPASGSLVQTDDTADITVTLNALAQLKPEGTYDVDIIFQQPATGFQHTRRLTLEVAALKVEPDTDVAFSGPMGGPFEPDSFVYVLYNDGLDEMPWRVDFVETTATPSGLNWLDISPSSGVILNPTGTARIDIAPSLSATSLNPGTYTASLTFISESTGATTQRDIELTVGDQGFALPMALIPAEDAQPNGPDYLYRISRFEVTNADYARFLNDTLHNPAAPASAFLVHDTVAQTVRLSGDGTVLFDGSVGSALEFIGDSYAPVTGKSHFPVVGVSWYGAVKFCNWMTLTQGMDAPDQRIYAEGPNAADFQPVATPAQLLDLRGFRLPMDGGSATASSFNEWYKAAAWNDHDQQDAVYGFGRDTLRAQDANYLNSGDPSEPGPTEVGYFDGVNRLADDITFTVGTSNSYALYDMTGNVAEWIHDDGADSSQRGIRGGHFRSAAGSPLLRNDVRGSLDPTALQDFVGFRVVQVIDPLACTVSQATGESPRTVGVVGGPYEFLGSPTGRTTFTLQLTNPGTQTLDDFTILITPAWLEIFGASPSQIPPGATVNVALQVSTAVNTAEVSPPPLGDFVLIPGSDVQTNGPAYDFWIGRTEVTNEQFAAFLNGARANAVGTDPDARSQYLYFDLNTGSVCINDKQAGEEGTDRSCDTATTFLYDATVGRIHLDDDLYEVEAAYETHPVVGVTWFGAVKYCNWLTLQQGLPASLRAYEEGTDPAAGGWHPVVVDDATWQNIGVTAQARQLLIEDTLGFRLPMDEQVLSASAYNEWYKAASRRPDDGSGIPQYDATYGMGRDGTLESTDANFFDSSDTATEETTPTGFFDGVNPLYQETDLSCDPETMQPTSTRDTENGYSLYDLTGNAAEWIQDFGIDPPNDRAVRGGSWRSDINAAELTTSSRLATPPESALDDVGFRVLRGTGQVVTVGVTDNLAEVTLQHHFILDLQEPFELLPRSGLDISGAYGDSFSNQQMDFTLTNRSDADMDWSIETVQDWVDADSQPSGDTEGTLDAHRTTTLTVTTNALVNDLVPGDYEALIILRNSTTGSALTRHVALNIEQPVQSTPDEGTNLAFSGIWEGPFTTPLQHDLTFVNTSPVRLDYSIDTDATWLDLEPTGDMSGSLDPGEQVDFTLTVNSFANSLAVGEFSGTVDFHWTNSANAAVSSTLEYDATLEVIDPIVVTQLQDPWLVGPDLTTLPMQTYAIENTHANAMEVSISSDVDWLDVGADTLILLSGQSINVDVAVNDNSMTLFDGEYRGALTVENLTAASSQCRDVVLTIGETLSIDPFADLTASGIPGGPIEPPGRPYRIINVARDEGGLIDWEVRSTSPGVDWLLLNRTPASAGSLAGSLDDGESTTVLVSIDPSATTGMTAGVYTADVEFIDHTNMEVATRTVTMTLANPHFTVTHSRIPQTADQPDGPTYTFTMSTFHTTNEQFTAFLNDALLNLDNERGAYLYFDLDTGDVYLHSSFVGAYGVDGAGTRVFDVTINPHIVLNNVSGIYECDAAYCSHPVTGVSWYGAVKYANWLTLDQGFSADQRCYVEAVSNDLISWRPVTISRSNWSTRDLNDAERHQLVTGYRGFRLPMDNGADNAVESLDAADAYNEWYKAAAWNTDAHINRLFAFGRDLLTPGDANYRDNGDPLDNDTTPVGFFDGTIKNSTFATNASENAFGLFDLCGNVFHWMQGRFNTAPNSLSFRTARGGSWNDPVDSVDLRANARNLAPPSTTDSRIGFRLVRVPHVSDGDLNKDGVIDAKDMSAFPTCLTGPDLDAGPSAIPGCSPLDLDEDGDIDLNDAAHLWLLIESH